MKRKAITIAWLMAAALAVLPAAAFAQGGESVAQITGVVRDTSGGVMPGVLVEVSSPALIQKVQSTNTDNDGRYRIINLPVGTYTVKFSLEGFQTREQQNVVLTSGFAATVNAAMAVGLRTETIVVTAEAPPVDTQNARQAITFQGDDVRELPTPRNVSSLLALTPGITSTYAPGSGSGICPGGVGVFCNPGVPGFNVGDRDDSRAAGGFNAACPTSLFFAGPGGTSTQCDDSATNLQQGRVMVDGAVINSTGAGITGLTGGFVADIANAQEITIQISGALGESETGGASINIVPRTGGNRFAGNTHTTYTRQSWFSTNGDEYETLGGFSNNINSVLWDYDVSGAYGGPIKRDRLWFYSVGRHQGKKAFPACCGQFYPNAVDEQFWGYFNYQPDYSQPSVTYRNEYKNVNARITWQATQKDKFNFFWDEQDFCQDPCYGVVSTFTSPESWWSVATKPNRLLQLSWTNPYTNKILLEAGLSATLQKYDVSKSREYDNPQHAPRVAEFDFGGCTAGMLPDGTKMIGSCPGDFGLTSGALVNHETRDLDNYRPRASFSYVTGSHNAKIGYEGGYFARKQNLLDNDPRLQYSYWAPGFGFGGLNFGCTPGAAVGGCGNTAIVNGVAQFPNDPLNAARRPRPFQATFTTGPRTLDEKVGYNAIYLQDQWTLKRLTVNGAIRFDHATSSYNPTCVGGNGSEPYMPVQNGGEYAGQRFYCTPKGDGVNYKDFTPRFGVAYDLLGNGRTSVKFNAGKYLDAAGLGGLYTGVNPARRTVNSLTRNWNDADADRLVDCNPLAAANGECTGGVNAQFGRDPLSLDVGVDGIPGTADDAPVGLSTTQCGRTELGIPIAVQEYCAQYGDTLLEGWGRRQANWQIGVGIQHEILPRLSGEVTYNRRMYRNLQVSDQLGIGCDRYPTSVGGNVEFNECLQGYLNFSNSSYDFYSVLAPADPDLPNGGNYGVVGNAVWDRIAVGAIQGGRPRAITYMDSLNYAFHSVDTNFVWRAPAKFWGLRLNGGTSTGVTKRDTCFAETDGPQVRGRLSNSDIANRSSDSDYIPQCRAFAPWQTRVNGTAAVTVPWVDVLVSGVIQSFPGVQRSANMTFAKTQVIWDPASQNRATAPCQTATNGVGCLGNGNDSNTTTVNLLNTNELFGERTTSIDLKLAKNLRFGNKRATVGVDVYNVLNSSAIQDYQDTYTPDDPTTTVDESAAWGSPQGVLTPRFARLSVQFYF